MNPAVGWYPDPAQPGIEHFWDGIGWTGDRPIPPQREAGESITGASSQSTVGFELPSPEVWAELAAGAAAGDPAPERPRSRRRGLRALSVVVAAAVVATGTALFV